MIEIAFTASALPGARLLAAARPHLPGNALKRHARARLISAAALRACQVLMVSSFEWTGPRHHLGGTGALPGSGDPGRLLLDNAREPSQGAAGHRETVVQCGNGVDGRGAGHGARPPRSTSRNASASSETWQTTLATSSCATRHLLGGPLRAERPSPPTRYCVRMRSDRPAAAAVCRILPPAHQQEAPRGDRRSRISEARAPFGQLTGQLRRRRVRPSSVCQT